MRVYEYQSTTETRSSNLDKFYCVVTKRRAHSNHKLIMLNVLYFLMIKK